jgi:hypothetical protein
MNQEESNQEVTEIETSVQPEQEPQIATDESAFPIPNMSFNRKFRKALLKQSGYTKLKNRLGFKDWFENIKNNVQNGKQLHASNMEENVKRMSEYIDKTNESIANFLVERGHSEERVAEIVEKNMEIQEKISRKKLKK